ncbi:PhyR family response regulator anti-anti-sigma factor [Novosphingobium sp. FKTRR1]|uniref:PhyR family response regulator anti-anti-sigma factor n=1 Tax=unclassified Novosphingobium TaxID=2644732 RepID=UPI001CF076B8|nr:response regulator [Novosphingobium sp. FKTRR1]
MMTAATTPTAPTTPLPGSGPLTGTGAVNAPVTPNDRLTAALPLLRRYARAVAGSQASGDAFVRATLEAALADPAMLAQITASPVGLYTAFTKVWTSGHETTADHTAEPTQRHGSQLERIPSRQRQALLLNQLEEFPIADTAAILGLEEAEAQRLVDAALVELAGDRIASLLIIEDEPLISSHIAMIIEEAGHTVAATATTAAEARAAFDSFRPDLVLSDVQLADGSTGIEAVDAILRISPVPVIFITSFPEMLLTGERPEPVFLISKPFREETLKTAISQALFFGGNYGR